MRDRQAVFFGPSETALFGIYHPGSSGMATRAVLLVYPMGQEYIRSHRAYLQLAIRLARAGAPVLRFDFSGCGDSFGRFEETRIERWLRDLSLALEELRKRSGLDRFDLVGVRLGGAVAAMAAAARNDVENLILWNPIVDGQSHWSELESMHLGMLRRSYVDSKRAESVPGLTEIMGYPFSSALAADIAKLNLLAVNVPPASRVTLIDSSSDERLPVLRDHFRAIGARVEIKRFDGPRLWLEEPNKAIVPNEIWHYVVQCLRKAETR